MVAEGMVFSTSPSELFPYFLASLHALPTISALPLWLVFSLWLVEVHPKDGL